MRYIFFDIETTNERLDFEIDKSELIEIGAYEPATGRTFQTFIKISHPLSEFTQRLTGITDSDLEDAPSAEKAIQDFLSFLGDPRDLILLGHNIEGFDIPVLSRYDEIFSTIQYLDTLQLFLLLYPGISEYNAEYLYQYFFNKPDHKEQHRGLQDAKEEAELFDKCLNIGAIRKYWDQKKIGSLNFAQILRK